MREIEIHVKAKQYFDEQYKGEYDKAQMMSSLQKFLDEAFPGEYTEEMMEEMVESALFLKGPQDDRYAPAIILTEGTLNDQYIQLIEELYEGSFSEEEIRDKVEQFLNKTSEDNYTSEDLEK